VEILSQVLADLVQGELMQLQTKEEEGERFEHYLSKSFNKTASLMAYSCKANAVLSGTGPDGVDAAFEYGRNIGIAFQLVDDLLDFVSSADQLGKPAAADLQLGLATAPVLFASATFPELNQMIGRRFSQPGDVETAFRLVLESTGLDQTRDLARTHCKAAIAALEEVNDSPYKAALVGLCDKVLNRLN
jgi:decaprenyl-diphosphate synthase subunit 1